MNTSICWRCMYTFIGLLEPFSSLICGNHHCCMLHNIPKKNKCKDDIRKRLTLIFFIIESGSWVVTLKKACRAIGETILLYSRYNNSVLYTKFRCLKVHKNENIFGSDFEFCTISLFVMHKY